MKIDYNRLQELYEEAREEITELKDQLKSFEPVERILWANKVCETLAEYQRNGEFFDPETSKYLARWIEITDRQ